MKEIVFLSGKGGTGKTSVMAGFASLTQSCILADCDVDASDLPIIMDPEIIESGDFVGGKQALINKDRCIKCGQCAQMCHFDAISLNSERLPEVDLFRCEGCGVCQLVCPADAITMEDQVSGRWHVSMTRIGPMVYARLGPAGENSGKLVTLLRKKAKDIAEKKELQWILCDGSPGIGCPVIASLTGADYAVLVTEATSAAVHDLNRILNLLEHFGINGGIVINRWDISPEMTRTIKDMASRRNMTLLGQIPFDREVVQAQLQGLTMVENHQGAGREALINIWDAVMKDIVKNSEKKRRIIMKIAIPVSDGVLCMHFGHCQSFAILEADPETGKVAGSRNAVPPPHEPGVLPRWLGEMKVDIVIAGGMGMRAQQLFADAGIKVLVGAPGETPEKLARDYLKGCLVTGRNVCDH